LSESHKLQVYSFCVALRFWHPTFDPDAITIRLGIEPKKSAQVGQPRVTQRGTSLGTNHHESYWHAEPIREGWIESAEIEAEDAVLTLLSQLEPNRDFILELVATSGRALIHISSYGPGNYALVFSSDLMARCSDLGLSLAHDIYQVAQA
jgi:hypothetical protein